MVDTGRYIPITLMDHFRQTLGDTTRRRRLLLNQEGGEIPIAESVNLQTGYLEAKGVKRTRVQEVPEEKLSIPSGR